MKEIKRKVKRNQRSEYKMVRTVASGDKICAVKETSRSEGTSMFHEALIRNGRGPRVNQERATQRMRKRSE